MIGLVWRQTQWRHGIFHCFNQHSCLSYYFHTHIPAVICVLGTQPRVESQHTVTYGWAQQPFRLVGGKSYHSLAQGFRVTVMGFRFGVSTRRLCLRGHPHRTRCATHAMGAALDAHTEFSLVPTGCFHTGSDASCATQRRAPQLGSDPILLALLVASCVDEALLLRPRATPPLCHPPNDKRPIQNISALFCFLFTPFASNSHQCFCFQRYRPLMRGKRRILRSLSVDCATLNSRNVKRY